MKIDKELMKGSTNMLVLSLLEEENMYGYQMIKRLSEKSNNLFELQEGTLYPILHGLEEKGLIESYWDETTGKKMREVYFDGKAKLHLQEYLNSRSDSNSALFVGLYKPYEKLKSRGIELMLQRLGEKNGISKVHPHKFRRTLATRAIDKGMPIEQVQHLLGHTKIETTLLYAMVN